MGYAEKKDQTAVDQEGLEVVLPGDGPEVVDDADLPEFHRHSSELKPEVAADYADSDKYFKSSGDDYAPEVDHTGNVELAQGINNGHPRKRRRWIILAIVAIIVVIAAVLGGVLGTVLNKKSRSTDDTSSQPSASPTPLRTGSRSGLASVISASDPNHLLTYYQDSEGRIIENSFISNVWTLEDRTNINKSIVTKEASIQSPLAAISYPLNGKTYRQVFYISNTGVVMTTNSSETLPGTQISTSWSDPQAITTDTVSPNGIGLAACWGDGDLNGIRVYYPSGWNWFIEQKYTFGEDGWTQGQNFYTNNDNSDVTSGVACAFAKLRKPQYMNVYTRWAKSGLVKQTWINYAAKNATWTYGTGPKSWENQTMIAGSDIAVASDPGETEYVYWQLADGSMSRGIASGTLGYYTAFDNYTLDVTVGSRYSAAFFNGGSMLVYPDNSTSSGIGYDNVSRYGVKIASGVVP